MKNLFLTLAFVLITALSFANINLSNSTQEKAEKTEKVEEVDGSIEVTLSCGISGTLSWTGNPSTSEILDAIQYFDDLLC
jgi:archaellin